MVCGYDLLIGSEFSTTMRTISVQKVDVEIFNTSCAISQVFLFNSSRKSCTKFCWTPWCWTKTIRSVWWRRIQKREKRVRDDTLCSKRLSVRISIRLIRCCVVSNFSKFQKFISHLGKACVIHIIGCDFIWEESSIFRSRKNYSFRTKKERGGNRSIQIVKNHSPIGAFWEGQKVLGPKNCRVVFFLQCSKC
jgi:hypothetical protein